LIYFAITMSLGYHELRKDRADEEVIRPAEKAVNAAVFAALY
jgi:hypothetical protein